MTSWVQLKGTNDNGLWVIPRPRNDPLSHPDLTAHISYTLLTEANEIEHRSVAKFRHLAIPRQAYVLAICQVSAGH